MDFSPLRQWSFIGTEGSSACWKSRPSRDVCCTPTGTHSSSWNINCPARMQTVPGKQTAFAIKAFPEVRSVIQDSTHSLLHPDSPCTDVHSGAKPQDAAARRGGHSFRVGRGTWHVSVPLIPHMAICICRARQGPLQMHSQEDPSDQISKTQPIATAPALPLAC